MSKTKGPLQKLKKLLSTRWLQILLGIGSIVVFVSAWAFVSYYLDQSGSDKAIFVPGPRAVADAFFSSFTSLPGLSDPSIGYRVTMWDLIGSSMGRFLTGFFIAFALALPLGLLMGSFRTAESLGRPIIEVFRPIPPLAWVPIFLLVFGAFIGPAGIVFLGAFFPILLNVMFGVKSVDSTLVDAARTLGAKRHDIFLKVVVPATIPYLMTGVKIGLGVAWMCIVAAEYIGAQGGAGLGYYISLSSLSFGLYPYTYATMIVIGILSVLTTGLAGLLEQRFYKWSGMK